MEDVSRKCLDGKRHQWVLFVNVVSEQSCFKCFKCGKKKSDWVKERPSIPISLSESKSDKELINIFLDSVSMEDIAPICNNAGLNKNRVYEAIVRFSRKGKL